MTSGERKTVAILGAGLLQQPFILAAQKLGLKVVALDQNSKAYARDTADDFLTVQIADAGEVIAKLTPLKNQLAFVCTVATDFSHTVGCVNDALNLPGLSAAQGVVLTHKGKMRDFCRDHGHSIPAYCYSASKADCQTWAKQNPSSDGFVIKPVQNMGARGVMFLKNADDLSSAFEFAQAHTESELHATTDDNLERSQAKRSGEVILEHYIPAREISVDALCFEGKVFLTGVADRIIEIKDGRFFIENGHTLPGNFAPREYTKILDTMQSYADSLSKLEGRPYHGALKGDLRLIPAGEIIIGEIAGRLSGGFMSTHTYAAAHGRSLMEMFTRLMLGDASVVLDADAAIETQGVAIERSLYAAPGELRGLPTAEKLDSIRSQYAARGLRNIFCFFKNGDVVGNLQNNIGKIFHTVIHAATLPEAERVFAEVREHLTFETHTPKNQA